jgi:uroporphyrinogen-III synthase
MAITLVTSEQGLSNLLELTHLPQQHNLKQNPLLVISPRLWRYAQKLGFQHIWQATSPQLTDIEYALRKLLNLG